MANDINGSLRNVLPGNIDYWNRVYATVADANAAIPSTVVGGRNFREGKVVQIGTVTNFVEHHWFGGFGDVNLVPKVDPQYTSKVRNELYSGNSDIAFWSNPNNVTYEFNSIISKPKFLIHNPIKITAVAPKAAYISYKVPVLPTDRVICGAWFHTPTLDTSGVTQFGFYIQFETGSGIVNRSILFSKAQLITGTSFTLSEIKSTIEVVDGDWVYISSKNISDFPSNIINFVYNPYANGTGASGSYSFNFANPTLLKGVSSIAPYIVYDNSAYVRDVAVYEILKQFPQPDQVETVESKQFNLFQEGATTLNFWSLPANTNTASFVDSPGVLPFKFPNKALKLTTTGAGKSNYAIRRVPVVITDRVVFGAWYYIPVLDVVGVTRFGVFGQLEMADASIVGKALYFTKSELNVGYTIFNGEMQLTVEAKSGDWVYISYKNRQNFTANTVALVINPFVTATGSAPVYDFYLNNMTFLKNESMIKPYSVYDNAAQLYQIIAEKLASIVQTSQLKNKRLVIDGDSLLEQPYIAPYIQAQTGCVLINNAKSGSGYVNNVNGTLRSRVENIASQSPDFVFLFGGTNDYGTNKPLGSKSVLNDDTQFYSAVYNTFRKFKEQNPTTPILVCLPLQRYYTTEVRGSVNTLGFSLRQYCDAIKEMAQIFAIETLDLYSISGITYENRTYYMSDGLHVNTLGGKLVGGKIIQVMNSLIKV